MSTNDNPDTGEHELLPDVVPAGLLDTEAPHFDQEREAWMIDTVDGTAIVHVDEPGERLRFEWPDGTFTYRTISGDQITDSNVAPE